MRLSEEQIKQAILYPERPAREIALRYFCQAFSQDDTILPLVIEVVEGLNWNESFRLLCNAENLPQTESTVQWCMERLDQDLSKQNEAYENFKYVRKLSSLLSNADPTLTLDKESEILGLPGFLPEAAAAFSERLRLFSEDTETLWDELIDFCEREYQKQYITDIDTPTADRIVEALARRGAPVAAKVLSMLNEDLDTSIYTPREFMQGFILQLAGEMQLTETIPLFIKTLKKDDADDWHNGICQRALVKIGGEEVFEAITQELPTDDWHFRLFGYSVLEEAHAGKNVEKYIELFNAEKDEDLKIILGRAALLHFSSTAIEPVRQFLLHRKEDPNPEITELCEYLVSVSTLLEIDFPEREKWKKENDKARMECDQKIAELERVFFKETIEEGGNVNDFIDKILQEAGGIVGAVDDDTLFDDNVFDDDGTFDEINNEYLESMSSESTILRSDIKIGRNDPCPCNSGKKYKKCCIKKNNEASLFN